MFNRRIAPSIILVEILPRDYIRAYSLGKFAAIEQYLLFENPPPPLAILQPSLIPVVSPIMVAS